jgi:glycine cleavage system H protein
VRCGSPESTGLAGSARPAQPVGGKITEVNESLNGEPEKINDDPYGEGRLIRMTAGDSRDFQGLMSAAQYTDYIESNDDP